MPVSGGLLGSGRGRCDDRGRRRNEGEAMTGNNGKSKAPAWEVRNGSKRGVRADEPGLGLVRRLTRKGTNPLDQVTWVKRDSVITNTDGSVVFEMKGVEVPEGWSQLATDIVVSKYFRKAGVPGV